MGDGSRYKRDVSMFTVINPEIETYFEDRCRLLALGLSKHQSYCLRRHSELAPRLVVPLPV